MACAAAVAAATVLLQVNTNDAGGTSLYREYRDNLLDVIKQIPEEHSRERTYVGHLMAAMDIRFDCKSLHTWRPFVVCVMRALKASCAELAAARKIAKFNDEDATLALAEEHAKLCAEGKLQKEIGKRRNRNWTPKTIKEEPSNSQASPCKQTRAESQRAVAMEDVALQGGLQNELVAPSLQIVSAVPLHKAAPKTGIAQFMVAKRVKFGSEQLQLAGQAGQTSHEKLPERLTEYFQQLPSSEDDLPLTSLRKVMVSPTASARTDSSSQSVISETTSKKSAEVTKQKQKRSVSRSRASVTKGREASKNVSEIKPADFEQQQHPPDTVAKCTSSGAAKRESVRKERIRRETQKRNAEESARREYKEKYRRESGSKESVPEQRPKRLKAGGGVASDPQGHYTRLCLTPAASAHDIRTAYRKEVLICHPDKGGNAQDFRATVKAYDILSNPEKRAEYDGEMATSMSSPPPPQATEEAGADKHQAAKDVYARMLATPEDEWSRLLQQVDPCIVEVLTDELDVFIEARVGGKTGMEPAEQEAEEDEFAAPDDRKAEEYALVAPDAGQSKDTDYSAPGIKRKKRGWWVQVAWRNVKVTAGEPIESMERAVNLYVALVDTRNSALARHKQALSDLQELNCKGKLDASDLDSCPVLTQNELFALLREEPYIPLHFSSDIQKKPDRIETPWTPSLETAMYFRLLVRGVQAGGGKVDDLRQKMVPKAREERRDRIQLTFRAASLLKEVASRFKTTARLAGAPRSEALASSEPQPLALMETVAAEALTRNMKALEEKVCALEDSHSKEEAVWQKRVHQLEEQHKTELLELAERHKQEQQFQERSNLLEERSKELDQRSKDMLEERSLQLEERQKEDIAKLHERLLEAERQKEISEQLAAKLVDNLHCTTQRPPNPFSRSRSGGFGARDSPDDYRDRLIAEAVQAASRCAPREPLVMRKRSLRLEPPAATALEPVGSYSLPRATRFKVQ